MTNRNRRKRPIPQHLYQQPYPAPVPFAYPMAPPPADGTVVAGVQTLSAKNATVAKVSVRKITDWNKGSDYEFAAADSSKREQGDRYDERAGELMALGRAYIRLGRDLLSAGSKRTQEVLAAQAAELEALEEKRNAPRRPVHRRTREEWEHIQRSHALAATLGLAREQYVTVDEVREANTAQPLPEDRTDYHQAAYDMLNPPEDKLPIWGLTHGRYLTIEDGHVIENMATGGKVRLTRA
jgi:hypothetical protein